jgi:A/G-specific adenine glycosylase
MNKAEKQFVDYVWKFFENSGRHYLPWRLTTDPYQIVVSELMLQQTQVDRVVPRYEAFIGLWPTSKALAQAKLSEVLIAWQGLGYNRRAKYLLETVGIIETTCNGVFPKTQEGLRSLPGIGPYTASAVCAFAYNQPVVLIETNVRRVFIHHFFPDDESVCDSKILPLVDKTLPKADSRRWYAALMDYGTWLKKEHGNANLRSKTYKKQSRFEGSDRQIRGAILRELASGEQTAGHLTIALRSFSPERVNVQLDKLLQEGLVGRSRKGFRLG